jgi:hypothetical protein
LSTHVYGNPDVSLQSTDFKVALPTAIHLSYSGNLLKNRYLTFGLTQRLPLTENSFKSPNLFYVNLAKTNRFLTYAAQFSMFEYKKLQFGGYLRFGPIFIGSDNILPVFFKQKKLKQQIFIWELKFIHFGIMPFLEGLDRNVTVKNNGNDLIFYVNV